MSAFLGHRAFHEEYAERDRKGQHGHHPKGVEIGERRCLLLAQILECLPGQLLRSQRIADLLQVHSPSLLEERSHRCIESIEGLAKPQGVKLIPPLLEGLRHVAAEVKFPKSAEVKFPRRAPRKFG